MIDILPQIATSSAYVASAPMFWQVMGVIASISIFIGAIIYDGQMKEATKGLITLFSYVGLLFWMTMSRVIEQFKTHDITDPHRAWAGVLTIIFSSVCFAFGIFLAVGLYRFKGWKK